MQYAVANCGHPADRRKPAAIVPDDRGLMLRLSKKLSFFEQPLARNHAFERILKKNRALRAHFFFPCINSEIHKVNCRIAAREGGLGHAPGNYEFAVQILFYACCRTKSENDRLTLSTD